MKQSDGQQVQVEHRLHDPAALVKLATRQVLVFLWLDQTSESGRRSAVVTLGNWGSVSFFFYLLDYIITVKNFVTVKLIIEAPAYTGTSDFYPRLVLETRLILETQLLLQHCQVATLNLFFMYIVH